MKSLRLLVAALPVSYLLVSCGLTHADARHPTVSQQDAYDVSWGLPPRKARGNPKMRYQYNPRAEQAEAAVNPAAAPEAAGAVETVRVAEPAGRSSGSPAVPAALR